MTDRDDSQLMRRQTKLILASTSAARRSLLENAGLPIEVRRPDVDEVAVRMALGLESSEVDPDDLAEVLARTKAQAVTPGAGGRNVIAGDQVLSCDGVLYEKPKTLAEAQSQLLALRGKTHRLHSAVVIDNGDDAPWVHLSPVDVTFRQFTPEFVGRYMAEAGDSVLTSVGAYQLEGLGANLVERIDGDYFAVLGLPLLPLLSELRQRGVLVA
jgi:septum formation protein